MNMHKRTRPSRLAALPLLACALALASCSTSAPKKFEIPGVRRAVVFPFDNLSSNQPNDAGRRLTGVFAAALYRTAGIEVVEPGEVERFIDEERIRGVDALNREVLASMGTRFNAQLIVIGVVNEFGLAQTGESVPVIGLSIRIVEPRTGRLVWSCTRTREGNDSETVFQIGKIVSLARLTDVIVDDLARELGGATKEIAQHIGNVERPEREPAVTPPAGEGPPGAAAPAAPQAADEEREEVKRAVKRHWQMIEEQRGK